MILHLALNIGPNKDGGNLDEEIKEEEQEDEDEDEEDDLERQEGDPLMIEVEPTGEELDNVD